METIFVSVKSETAAHALKEFLGTIDYVEKVHTSTSPDELSSMLIKGEYKTDDKPSDFAGIWKRKKKKTDATKLRKKAWTRKK